MRKNPNVIGLTGRAQAGKDTVGAILVEKHGYTRFAFADALKSMALALNPFVDQEGRLADIVAEGGWELAKTIPEVRRFLQVLGTEGVRDHLGENSWVDALQQQLMKRGLWTFEEARHVSVPTKVVITDVRFPNEVNAVYSRWYGEVWRVKRDVPLLGHASERFVDDLPATSTIVNEGTLEDLEDFVSAALAEPRVFVGPADALMERYR